MFVFFGVQVGFWYVFNIMLYFMVGIGIWSQDELVVYFKIGCVEGCVQVVGSMVEVIMYSFFKLIDEDLCVIVVYFKEILVIGLDLLMLFMLGMCFEQGKVGNVLVQFCGCILGVDSFEEICGVCLFLVSCVFCYGYNG